MVRLKPCAFPTQFSLDRIYATQFTSHNVGSAIDSEHWVPAEQLAEFDHHLACSIVIVSAECSDGYFGSTDLKPKTRLVRRRKCRDIKEIRASYRLTLPWDTTSVRYAQIACKRTRIACSFSTLRANVHLAYRRIGCCS